MGLPVRRMHALLSQTSGGYGDLEVVVKGPASSISPYFRGLPARGSVPARGSGQ